MLKTKYEYWLIAFTWVSCYLGQLKSVRVSDLILYKTLLKISIKYSPFLPPCDVFCAVQQKKN